MSNLLNQLAVGRKDGEDAQELLGAYLGTQPNMAFNHTAEAAPSAPAAAPGAPGMGGGSGNRSTAQAVVAGMQGDAIAKGPEYEVFRNGKNALAFFLYRQGALDNLSNDGPYWFQIDGNRIVAGDAAHKISFDDLAADILSVSRERGVIMLVEFENQQPVRCTPCYYTDMI